MNKDAAVAVLASMIDEAGLESRQAGRLERLSDGRFGRLAEEVGGSKQSERDVFKKKGRMC